MPQPTGEAEDAASPAAAPAISNYDGDSEEAREGCVGQRLSRPQGVGPAPPSPDSSLGVPLGQRESCADDVAGIGLRTSVVIGRVCWDTPESRRDSLSHISHGGGGGGDRIDKEPAGRRSGLPKSRRRGQRRHSGGGRLVSAAAPSIVGAPGVSGEVLQRVLEIRAELEAHKRVLEAEVARQQRQAEAHDAETKSKSAPKQPPPEQGAVHCVAAQAQQTCPSNSDQAGLDGASVEQPQEQVEHRSAFKTVEGDARWPQQSQLEAHKSALQREIALRLQDQVVAHGSTQKNDHARWLQLQLEAHKAALQGEIARRLQEQLNDHKAALDLSESSNWHQQQSQDYLESQDSKRREVLQLEMQKANLRSEMLRRLQEQVEAHKASLGHERVLQAQPENTQRNATFDNVLWLQQQGVDAQDALCGESAPRIQGDSLSAQQPQHQQDRDPEWLLKSSRRALPPPPSPPTTYFDGGRRSLSPMRGSLSEHRSSAFEQLRVAGGGRWTSPQPAFSWESNGHRRGSSQLFPPRSPQQRRQSGAGVTSPQQSPHTGRRCSSNFSPARPVWRTLPPPPTPPSTSRTGSAAGTWGTVPPQHAVRPGKRASVTSLSQRLPTAAVALRRHSIVGRDVSSTSLPFTAARRRGSIERGFAPHPAAVVQASRRVPKDVQRESAVGVRTTRGHLPSELRVDALAAHHRTIVERWQPSLAEVQTLRDQLQKTVALLGRTAAR